MNAAAARRLWGPGGVRLALADAAIVAGLVVASLLLAAWSPAAGGGAGIVEVTTAAGERRILELGCDGITAVRGPLGETRIEVRNGRVRILSSPCPRQRCRHEGWAAGVGGGLLVCVPNGVVVRTAGVGSGDVDARSR